MEPALSRRRLSWGLTQSVSRTKVKDLAATLGRMSKETRKQLRALIVEIAKDRLAKTRELVPVKTGKLRDSGRVSVRVGAQQLSAKIIYGGPDVPYALKVHEDLEMKHPGGGRAKFVESVLMSTNFASEILKRLDLAAAAK